MDIGRIFDHVLLLTPYGWLPDIAFAREAVILRATNML